jgi:tetratricopeptide (TPR) repeat protein
MEKLKIIPWIIIIILLITQVPGYEFFELNQYSITVAKNIMRIDFPVSQIISRTIQNPTLGCHATWLEYRQLNLVENDPSLVSISPLMSCSNLHLRMLSRLYPDNLELADLAIQLYPDEVTPYYWLINATDPSLRDIPKNAVQKILSINPKDGLAWRYQGLIYLKEGNIPAAIDAHINCCNNGDPGSNGCFRAGGLLEREGRFVEAIYYYRLSKFPPSQEAAHRLEAELSSQNP